MFLSCVNRNEAIALLPKGGSWAEIGVFRGDLSEQILDVCQPKELHLVDPWHFDLDFDWFSPPDYSEKFGDAKKLVSQLTAWTAAPPVVHINDLFETIYQGVKARFAGRPEVIIHRQTARGSHRVRRSLSRFCVRRRRA